MNKVFRIPRRLALLVLLLTTISGTLLAEISVSLSDNCYPSGGDITVPLNITGVDSEVIYSLYTKITYDTTVVTLTDVTTGSDLPGVAQLNSNSNTPGEVILAIWGTDEIGANGNFANLAFAITGAFGTGTDLEFDYFYFNEGSPSAVVDDGIVFHGDPDPWLDNPGTVTYDENDLVSFDLIAHDPLNLALSLTMDTALPTGASFVDNGDGTGTITWQTDYLDGGTYNLTVSVENEDLLTDSESFDLVINNVTQPPVVENPIADFSFDEDTVDTSIDLNNVFTDYDIEFGDYLTFDYFGASNIGVSIVNGLVTLTPAPDWHGTEEIIFIAADTNMRSTDEVVLITVLNVNDAPYVVNTISPITIQEDGVDASIDLNQVFGDVDGDMLSYSWSGNANISVSEVDGYVTLTPLENWFGDETITFTADDMHSRVSVDTSVQVTVDSVNDLPYAIATIGAIVISVNGSYNTVSLDSIFNDIDSSLTYSVRDNVNISYQLNVDNTLTLTPAADWYGTENITVVATDDYNEEVVEVVQVTVSDFSMTEDFNHGGALPTGWSTQHAGNTVSPWTPVNEAGVDWNMYVANGVLQSSDEKLLSPVYDLSGYSELTISFNHNYAHGDNASAYLQVTNNGTTFQNLATFNASTSGNVTYNFDAASYVQFRWYFNSFINLGASWTIDDVVISGRVADSTPPTVITDLDVDSFTNDTITLSWSPTTDQFFDYYELFYSTSSVINIFNDPVWGVSDDANLGDINTVLTTITPVNFNTKYYIAIRGVDVWGNVSDISNTVECIVADPVIITTPYPTQPATELQASRTVEIGVTITDDFLVDAESVQYRIDANGNGTYDGEESWIDVTGYSDGIELVIRENVTYNADGEMLYFEFRAQDEIGSPMVYSGTSNQEGIADDYHVAIDTIAPTQVSDLLVTAYDGTTLTLSWTPVTELHFNEYLVYYSQTEGVTTSDMEWNQINDSNLANITTDTTTVTGLQAGTMYYFAIMSNDTAGNNSLLSDEVASVPRSDLPTCSAPYPETPTLGNSRTVTVGCTFEDYFGIDESSIQYRIDANGNGAYDAEEVWVNYQGRVGRDRNLQAVVRVDVTYDVDGEMLPFELRAWDVDGYGPVYSGSSCQEGIADDYYVAIDSVLPTQISTVVAYSAGSDAIDVYWTSSSDLHFTNYEVYYATHAGVTTDDMVWGLSDDPTLANIGAGFTSSRVTGLNPGTTYYFKIRALDSAGNASLLSAMEASNTTEGSFAPAVPQNIVITTTGNDVVLTWDPVATNTNGDPMTITGYEVYSTSDPDFEIDDSYSITEYDGDSSSADTSFTHSGILNSISTHLFYKVTAVEGARQSRVTNTREAFIRYLSENKREEVR